jgi:thiamine biosynthesis lipoprotein
VGIQHPRAADYFGFVEATSGSISTSGDYEHSFVKDGKRWHHIIDTKTGLPVAHTASVTVVADAGIYADALSTAVFVLGAKRALARLSTAPGHPRVAIVDGDMRLHTNDAMQKSLILREPLSGGKLPETAAP